MTESEWLTSEDPQAMLREFYYGTYSVQRKLNHPSDRKLRLFACACSRTVYSQLSDVGFTDPKVCIAIEVAERYADGVATAHELATAYYGDWPASFVVGERADWCARQFCEDESGVSQSMVPLATQACILRDICGNPWRPGRVVGPTEIAIGPVGAIPLTIHSEWLTPDVIAIARVAYEEREPEGALQACHLLPLSDALEEAGCAMPRKLCKVAILGESGAHQWPVVCDYRPGGIGCIQSTVVYVGKSLRDAQRYAEANLAVNYWYRQNLKYRRDITENWAMWGDGYCPAEVHPILSHLRSPGPHYRGCWALDLILGKE